MKQSTEPFEELMIPRRDLYAPSAMLYRVYSDYNHFELVEAVSALDALAASKIKNVYKIERHDPLADNVIHLSQVANHIPLGAVAANVEGEDANVNVQPQSQEAPIASVLETKSEPAIEPEPASIAAAPQEDAPLSNDDIDKLLNG